MITRAIRAIHFNSRPSARGDAPAPAPAPATDISIHAPPRGATQISVLWLHCATFQFTPLREGRQGRTQKSGAGHISIHAPPRGATVPFPVKVSTLSFQFTPLREGRRNFRKSGGCVINISIHAPPRGATRVIGVDVDRAADFNSRPSARGDSVIFNPQSIWIAFQFTPLREGRPGTSFRALSLRDFNSRPSARGDVCRNGGRSAHGLNFNSRPSARGDEVVPGIKIIPRISIHAPPRGATGADALAAWLGGYFNSRPSARGDGRPGRR